MSVYATWTCMHALLFLCLNLPEAFSRQARVAIIGAGVGGATTAYHLRDQGYEIDLFESNAIGGRVQEMVYEGQVMERGAAMIWEKNLHLANLAQELHLKTKVIEGSGFSIYDGTSIVFSTPPSWTTPLKVIQRYGLSPLVYGRHAMKVWMEHFYPIYGLQQNQTAFSTPEEMLTQLGLYGLSQESCEAHAKSVLMPWSLWGAGRFMEEMAAAVNRCNYNQRNSQMNALAGLVSFLPAAGGTIWAFTDGNGGVAAAMINASGARISTPCSISQVTVQSDGRFSLKSTCSDEESDPSYDAVVLAAPLELANITFILSSALHKKRHIEGATDDKDSHIEGATADKDSHSEGATGDKHCSASIYPMTQQHVDWASLCRWVRCGSKSGSGKSTGSSTDSDRSARSDGEGEVRPRKFQRTIATFVAGNMQHSYFGAGGKGMPETVYLSEGAEAPFSAISLKHAGEDINLYKVFSSEALGESVLRAVFGPAYRVVSTDDWSAYPQFSPPESFTPFTLAPGIFYNNAIENAASAMEMSVIAGVNSALLVRKWIDSIQSHIEADS